MRTYHVGYFNKPNQEDFVVMAQCHAELVAGFIQSHYNEAYERTGMNIRLVVLVDDELPADHRFMEDL